MHRKSLVGPLHIASGQSSCFFNVKSILNQIHLTLTVITALSTDDRK